MRRSLQPAELLSLLFLGFLCATVIVSAPLNPSWTGLLATYAALAAFIAAAAAVRKRFPAGQNVFYLSVIVMIVTILTIFNSLGPLIAGMHTRMVDSVLISVDYGLFGVHPTVWMERFINPILTAVLQFAYISYYFIPISLGVVLITKDRFTEFEEALFGIALCFYLSYVGYLIFPAVGPRFTLDHLQTSDLKAPVVIRNIQALLNGLEKNKTDAFPSGHTAVALMSLYYAGRFREKELFAGLTPVVTALIVSTVYLRYHYVIDVIAGIALTVLTVFLAPVLRRGLLGASGQTCDENHRAPRDERDR